MHDQRRSRFRRRTAGMTMVRSWTRWSVGAGVVLSAALSAGLGYVLPGHAANTPARHGATPAATTSRPAPEATATATGHRHVHHHHKRHRLTPPAGTPRPAAPHTQAPQPPTQQPPPATSGGS